MSVDAVPMQRAVASQASFSERILSSFIIILVVYREVGCSFGKDFASKLDLSRQTLHGRVREFLL